MDKVGFLGDSVDEYQESESVERDEAMKFMYIAFILNLYGFL
jgi:hypothetical protein